MYKFKEIKFPDPSIYNSSIHAFTQEGWRVDLDVRVQYRMWVDKSDIDYPEPTDLEEWIRTDADRLVVNTGGSTNETPLHEWAKNPLQLCELTDIYSLYIREGYIREGHGFSTSILIKKVNHLVVLGLVIDFIAQGVMH